MHNQLSAAFFGQSLRSCAGALMLLLGIGGCGHSSQIAPTCGSSTVFVSPEKALGDQISIVGFLRYGFENRNLYPDELGSEQSRTKTCLPVLIKINDTDLLDIARRLDSTYVVIQGTIENIASPGMVSLFTCKPIGIRVTAIRQRG
ncbi:hypothetical protein [Massilia scottii]|uniref:hypothetical protein n=1 Tax=Massilia scottii TaxID=3057166 RepID=UPI002796C524|nr:hypothetical protein [Massilia sp. CCM 9029]MDQ1830319.1 hypothetical protein [Massilia sp. CCM 9029]